MTFRGLLAIVLALAVLVLPAWAAQAQTPQVPVLWDAKERLPKPDLSALPRLRFLTTTDFPPFNFLDGSGRLSGFHIDLARAICAELGMADKCQIEALPWAELEGALARGEGEAVIAGVAATAETREKYVFSRPYLQFPARFIVPKAKPLTEPIYDKIQGKPVGVLAGSAHEHMLQAYFGTVKVVPFAKPEELYAGLKAGKVDAAFGDGMRLSFWLAGEDAANCCRFGGGPYIAPEYLGTGLSIAAKVDQPVLAAAFDYALQEISEKGVFAELYLRYFPVSFY
ncbi:amino acid ABC transporter [Mesorhizobium sp. Root552]|nr:amino acid ABC transporter [Mesorhizobium sp. Root552]